MIYLSGVIRPELPAMITPRMGQRPPEGQPWAADNGRFASPKDYTDAGYLAWLDRMPAESCLFATLPDVVCDASTTLLMSIKLVDRVRAAGYKPAWVAQNGSQILTEFIPWPWIDAVFLGGDTAWKLGPGAALVTKVAKDHGKWVHMGRVNSLKRLRYAKSIGCDSADGTVLKFDPKRDVAGWVETVNADA